ncbi:hypothetical protein DFJ58DRAFT_860833 [Suillus subalutaceus]|uniref:uncharacterized protein n=1 Tax=Suillus subalutaceus TaxID=48586 RepID=UPI001B882B00|nr:uncharacterized protein DFJ58DRAFT_860833 [Suillus subalutaceus]KAG1838821.1 hypothetical protein DFJ58DRAFT_860833 [Suillus subalutaceus]
MDPTMIPSPKFTGRQAYSFKLPLGDSVVRAQLLSGDKILLATTDRLHAIEGALTHWGRGKKLNRDKIGEFILAFDESKRLLSVVARERLLLHIFVHYSTRDFQASGSAINLTQWYGERVSIIHACFICGSEELLLVDSLAQARIYSLTTMQFRPATLDLIQIPKAVYSTPDGSCLIVTHDVVDSDKAAITRKFAIKCQKIVQNEQDANFISRLHAGQLNMIPWPVIESQEFHQLFPALKRQLDKKKKLLGDWAATPSSLYLASGLR